MGSLAAVEGDDEWWLDGAQQLFVGGCCFLRAPVPGDDVVGGGHDEQALVVQVGAVVEDLVVNAMLIDVGAWLDKPVPVESSVQRLPGDPGVLG